MSGRRVLALYGALLLGFAAVVCRLYWLCSNTGYAARASAQSEAVLRLPAARGNFYDCDGLPLTGLSEQWLALCFPGEGSYARLYPYADADGQAVLYRERNASRPFLLEVAQDVRGLGVRCYAVPRRYAAAPLAEHLIGYLDGEGRGAAGLCEDRPRPNRRKKRCERNCSQRLERVTRLELATSTLARWRSTG